MPFSVYILECADGSLYAGYTNDLERRVKQHNGSKQGARYTKARRPVVLKYSEKYKTIGEALRREAEIKHWPRKKKLELIKVKVRHKIKAGK
jgi:putative endonuclease